MKYSEMGYHESCFQEAAQKLEGGPDLGLSMQTMRLWPSEKFLLFPIFESQDEIEKPAIMRCPTL